jgi:hypothetical protein
MARSTMRAVLACAMFAGPLMAAPAQAEPQYRPGLPPVLAPETAPPAPAVEERFRKEYARAGRPRIVLYWNRELDDELVDRKTQQVDIRAAGVEAGPVAVGAVRIDRAETVANRWATGGLPPHLAAVEAAFVQHLAQHGVRLVDRAAILRLEHARARGRDAAGQGAAPDARVNEIDALSALADLLIEITVLNAGATPGNVEFKLLAKDTRTGAMPFSLATRAGPPQADPGGFVAGPDGFVRSSDCPQAPRDFVAGEGGFVPRLAKPRSMSDVGRQLAVDTMAAWAGLDPAHARACG